MLNFFRHYSAVLVIFALIFNSTAPVLASAWSVNQAQQYATDDVMMICTGSTFKWISTSAFFEAGQVVFVEPPADAPNNIDNLDCSFSYIAEHHTDDLALPPMLHQSVAYEAIALVRAKRPYTSFNYQPAQTRAPPHL